jgi:cytochrome c-type biogenesis protein CcmH
MAVSLSVRLAAGAFGVVLVGLAALALMRRHSAPPHEPVPVAAPAAQAAASSAAPAPLSASQVEHGIDSAREAVKADPTNADAWAMLAHSSEMLGRFDQAVQAYRTLVVLRPKDAQVHADFADALGVTQRGSLEGEPARMIARALELDPANLKALVLAGKENFERQRYAQAIDHWQGALKATPDAAVKRSIETSIAEARALAAPPATAGSAASGAGDFVSGRVTVAAELKSRIAADDTVFVFARPASGSRMPVALLRKRGSDLPLDFALDDTLAMVPQSRLSQQPQVIIGVRVSRRGDAIPVAGDLEGELGPVPLGSTGLKLEISRARP